VYPADGALLADNGCGLHETEGPGAAYVAAKQHLTAQDVVML